MDSVRCLFAVIVCLAGAGTSSIAQDDDKRPAGRRSTDDSVLLDKLPVPPNGTIVVTPDLKKALDSLGAGSVVLSAERYLELTRQAAQAREKIGTDVLLSTLRIEGEIKTTSGREAAELVFDLEFRTDTPNAVVPVPFKGVRFTAATLNGAPPLWGPDPSKLCVLVKEPQTCRMRLTTTVPITRVGAERRLNLERIPPAAVTALDLVVGEPVIKATVLGSGPVAFTKGMDGRTRLQSTALGILSSFELTWRSGEAKATGAEAIEGDIRITLEDDVAQVEARLRPRASPELPWKVRLPAGATQIKAELLRAEGLGSEPLVITRGTDGVFSIISPYPTAPLDATLVSLQWRQSVTGEVAKGAVLLGCCEVVEPSGRSQTGTINVVTPETPRVMLHPVHLTTLERDIPSGERNRRVSRYRYTQQPAGLEAIPLPASQVRGAVEYKLDHTLAVHEGAWQLATSLEITRTARAQLTQLELNWPGDWPVSRKVLFSPMVREVEQDINTHKVRILLDGKLPGAFSLRLECTREVTGSPLTLPLPRLVAAQGLQGERSVPIELVAVQERVRLDQRGYDLRVDPMSAGLQEEDRVTNDAIQLHVTAHPAQLVVAAAARAPKYRGQVEVFVTAEGVETRQTFDLRWNGPAPRRLHLLVPAGARAVHFARLPDDTDREEPLTSILATTPGDGNPPGWETHALDVPAGSESGLQLVAYAQGASGNPLTVSLLRFLDGQASLEGSITAHILHDRRVSLKVPELPGWRTLEHRVGEWKLRGDSFDQLLALEVAPVVPPPGTVLARARVCRATLDHDAARLVARYHWEFQEVWTTELALVIHCSPDEVALVQGSIDGQPLRAEPRKATCETGTLFTLKFPPSRLQQPMQLILTFQFAPPSLRDVIQVPAVAWSQGQVLELERSWRVPAPAGTWLLHAKPSLDEVQYVSTSWLPVQPVTNGVSGTFLSFRDAGGDGSLRLVTIPRTAAVLVLSFLALCGVRLLAARRDRIRWTAGGLLILLIVVHLAAPAAAAVLLWGLLPGTILGLLLLGMERWTQRRRTRRPAVFQPGLVRSVAKSISASAPSVVLAEAPTLVPETRTTER